MTEAISTAGFFKEFGTTRALEITATPVVALVAISAALATAGIASLCHRNLALPT